MVNRGEKFLAKSRVLGIVDQIVVFEGVQKVGFEGYPDFPLYTLTERIEPNHSAGSTVARIALEKYGYVLPKEAP